MIFIITIAATPTSSIPTEPLDQSSLYPHNAPKKRFAALAGLSGSCRMSRIAVQREWYRVLYVRQKGDWRIINDLGIAGYVRELRVLSAALGKDVSQDVFMQFTGLHTAVIDAHNDFELNQLPETPGRVGPVGQYYNVAPRLPKSLRRLHIANAHGPDIAAIQTLRSCCPEVQELSISRCTLFSPRLSCKEMQCTFWAKFPNDHDSYFANEGIEDYAAALASELKSLQHLKSLHMGLYLTPHAAISAHIENHYHKSAKGSPWDLPCEMCSKQFGSQTHSAEVTANEVMFRELPQLQDISWASFFSPTRQDSICYVRPYETTTQRVDIHISSGQLSLCP